MRSHWKLNLAIIGIAVIIACSLILKSPRPSRKYTPPTYKIALMQKGTILQQWDASSILSWSQSPQGVTSALITDTQGNRLTITAQAGRKLQIINPLRVLPVIPHKKPKSQP